MGAETAGWKWTWSDEFDGGQVDASVWGYETGYVRNNEDQYYSNRLENSRTDNGHLLIQALRDNWSGHAYTSASRTTRGKKSWRYGRFEIRARIDIRLGSWPAWWWLPDAGGWPKGGEIDMMEFYRGKCLFNVMDGNQKWTSITREAADLGGSRWSEAFHVWTMEWDSTRIDLSLDGKLINHYAVSLADGSGPDGANPFRRAGYMILNQALGGDNGGDPTGTSFPVEMRVDWLRVHEWTTGPSHGLQVMDGAGSGVYLDGTKASITAAFPPVGQVFNGWVVETGSAAALADAASSSTLVTMPASDVMVRATYRSGSTSISAGGNPVFRRSGPTTKRHSAYSADGKKIPSPPRSGTRKVSISQIDIFN